MAYIIYEPDPDEPVKLPCSNIEDCQPIREAIAARPPAERDYWNNYWKPAHASVSYNVWTCRTGPDAGKIIGVNGYTQDMANAYIAQQLHVATTVNLSLAHPRPEDDPNKL